MWLPTVNDIKIWSSINSFHPNYRSKDPLSIDRTVGVGLRIMGKWSQKSVRNCYSYSNCQKLIEQALLTKTATSEYSTFIKSVNYNSQAWTSEDHRHMSWGRGMKGLHAPWIEQSKFLGQLLHFSGRNQQPKMKKTQNSFKEGER